MNGKVISNVGQRVALWPDFPQEKHFISAQSRCTGRCLNSWSALSLPSRKSCSLVSNFISSVCIGKVGFLVATFSVKSWANLSKPASSGTLVVGVAFGVSISTSFLSSSLVSSTGHSHYIHCHCPYWVRFFFWCLDHISRIRRLRSTGTPSRKVGVTFPYPAPVRYIPEGCIWGQTVQMPAQFAAFMTSYEPVSN